MWVQSGTFICPFIVLNSNISFNFCARLGFNVIWFVKFMTITKLKIEIISIRHNSLTQCTAKFFPLSYTRRTKTISLNLVLTHSLHFFIGNLKLVPFLLVKVSVVSSASSSFCCNYVTDTFCGNYTGGNVCCIYAGFEVVLSLTGMLVDLSVVIMQVTVFVAIMQLEGSAAHMQVPVSAANMWVTIFIVIMHMGVCYNYAGGIFCKALYT